MRETLVIFLKKTVTIKSDGLCSALCLCMAYVFFTVAFLSTSNANIVAKSHLVPLEGSVSTIVESLGKADGIATLGPDGKVPTEQLPAGSGGTQVNADWNATSGTAQILNKPEIGTTSGTIAAGDDFRFMAIPSTQPDNTPAPAGWVYVWFE